MGSHTITNSPPAAFIFVKDSYSFFFSHSYGYVTQNNNLIKIVILIPSEKFSFTGVFSLENLPCLGLLFLLQNAIKAYYSSNRCQ